MARKHKPEAEPDPTAALDTIDAPPSPSRVLTLPALLLGKARTADPTRIQVTLRIQQDILTLNLSPEDAQIFPDLSALEGGGHPLYDPHRITYNTIVPIYKVVITPVAPEPLVAEASATPELMSDSAAALAPAAALEE